jgi:2-keto-4-pentenoate hydratase/2-oxohepta-3-ene-1,7-dioic acid hydratase in catechol pathway
LVSDNTKPLVPRCEVTLATPVTGMDKVICIGMNYKDHCEEQNAPVPTEPVVSFDVHCRGF